MSRRKVGDPTPFVEMKVNVEKIDDHTVPYAKTNWDGRELKCTTICVRDKKNNPVGLICINFDTTIFQKAQDFLVRY